MTWTTTIPEKKAGGRHYSWWRRQSQPETAVIVLLDEHNRTIDPRGPGFNRTIAAEDLGGEWGDGEITLPSEPEPKE